MRRIKDIVSKPSMAIKAMIAGLKRMDQKPYFKIDMSTFGLRLDGICYGCAATCAVQEIAGKDFTGREIETSLGQGEYLNFDPDDLWQFEEAIDSFRMGITHNIFEYYGIDHPEIHTNWYVSTSEVMGEESWKDSVPAIEAYITKLEKLGL